ncbi:hypothetical protein A9P82_14355 [Arachidicoccus ginsenosidimutans]|uniref:hypothetical protein n=1 Tax=Arachidicoccus sp. BS20 TaxID=1850526 RepID=UPI0007F14245|nr:hypothetical protein [Arachidicoccus sp. BS20]ANI90367.1 hypothetical protein A9P82_14355 [Arachidicoccus sp. BS20]
MQINKSQAAFLEDAIDDWKNKNIITSDKAEELKRSFSVREFDWKNVAKYAFIIAIVCGVIAVVATFADRKLINFFDLLIEKLFNASNLLLGIICAIIAAVFFYFGQKWKQENPDKIFTNEGFILMGSAFAAFTAANFANLSGKGDAYYITTFLLATIFYVTLSFLLKSQIIWLLGLLAFTCWVCVLSANATHWQPYFLGLNYALRFFVFSILFLIATYFMKRIKQLQDFYSLTCYYTLCLFFISLWIVSVCGNYGTWEEWNKVPQIHLFGWALLSMGVSAIATYIGWKKDLPDVRNFGITFLFLNIYTRYFEYFWNGSYKAVFFIVLALSFWLIGRSAEKIWNKPKP